MAQDRYPYKDENLDPLDWHEMRALGHRIIDEMMDYIQSIPERPGWQHAPSEIKDFFSSPPPRQPQSPEDVYEDFYRNILPYPMGNNHPRFWGWIAGTGTVMGAYADMLAAGMNTPSGSFAYHSSNYVERQLIDWFKELLGYPSSASGLLTSGGSAANLIALAVARNTKAGYNLRSKGLQAAPKHMTIYASSEIHSSIQKSVELLGLGSDSLRKAPVNGLMQVNHQALEEMINEDRQNGLQPFCVVGAAGTTNTGAIDDLNALADICERENLWYHVDGAFGAWAAITPGGKELVSGMERADSLSFDLHKWMYIPYAIGCVLVRSEEQHRGTFSLTPDYLAHGEGERGMTGIDLPWQSDYGFELSRGFTALKAWMSIKEHGVDKFGRLIQQNIDQAHYLAELVKAAPGLELALPVTLNVVCFRYFRVGIDDKKLDAINKQIEIELQENGIAMPSTTTLHNRRVLHVACTNHRSRKEDFEVLVREVIRIGDEISG